MDVATIQNKIQALPPDQQDRISAFLTFLRMKRQGVTTEISRRLDDNNSQSWVSWDEAKTILSDESSEKD